MEITLATAAPPYWQQIRPQLAALPDDLKADRLLGVDTQCPLSLKLESESRWWQLPIEPVIAVRGRNTIVKRSVLKIRTGDKERRGTVKELWSLGDYEVSIAGVLQSREPCQLPEADLRRLRHYCEARESLEALCPLLDIFGIRRLSVESFDFPHTTGLENLTYSLSCLSDDFHKESLLLAD